jgi:hypothetical protein
MQSNVADQDEEITRLIRFAPSTSRPLSAVQPLWQGSLPQGIKLIATRAALDQSNRDWYAKWATNFALLTDEFLIRIFERELSRIKQLDYGKWSTFPFVEWHYCQVGDNYLWIQKQDQGWTVELCYPDSTDPDVRILTIENMPVLCSEPIWATRLALACYPEPSANLVWHSYW